MGGSILDWVNAMEMMAKPDSLKLTKKQFGEIMHGLNFTEEERLAALKKMELAGGYDGLLD